MPEPSPAYTGIVHGRFVELDREPPLPDGQAVYVTVAPQYATIIPAEPIPDDIPRAEQWVDRLVFDPAVLSGQRIVKGTNLAAEPLVGEIERGASDNDLLHAHPELTAADVDALRAYARTPALIRQSAGIASDDAAELDEYLEWSRRHRQIGRRGIEE